MKKLALFLLLLSQATSHDFLARGGTQEVRKPEGNDQPAALSSGGDGDSSGTVVRVPLDSELQAAPGKVTAVSPKQSAIAESNGQDEEDVFEAFVEENEEQEDEGLGLEAEEEE